MESYRYLTAGPGVGLASIWFGLPTRVKEDLSCCASSRCEGTNQLIERLLCDAQWCDATQGWQGAEASLHLSGWSRARRVVVLHRRLAKDLAVEDLSDPRQLRLSFTEVEEDVRIYEYAVLVTSLEEEILTIAALYRDRSDCEFDTSSIGGP